VTRSSYFRQAVVVDFEYEIEDGGLPDVLCMVAYILNTNLQHVRTIKLWRGEFGPTPPFDIGRDTLFVAYSAWAELTCFLQLGWRFPVHILDLHTAYLSVSNILLAHDPGDEKQRKKARKRLPDACRAYGIEGWERIDKDSIAADIGAGNWHKYGREGVIDYCEEDVRMSMRLLRQILRGYAAFAPLDVPRVLHWSNYSAKCIARIQARGIPIDTLLWNLVQENKRAVIGELLRRFDPSYCSDDPIYTPEGEWSYARFERWLPSTGILAWPRLESGVLDISSDAFRMMSHHPGIENLHALRDSVGFIAKARLPIGADGRNRPSLFPFGTATGRNAHAKSPYNAHAGVRGFIQFLPDTIGAYLDWRTQEVGIAAVLSGDEALTADYRSGDVYHALARMCGQTDDPDPKHWKRHNPEMRQRMKPLQLGINYGMGVPSLARGLNQHPLIASGIIEKHKRTYPRFWEWRNDTVTAAMLQRRVESSHGWQLRITSSPNKRTLCNFPMQSGGAEMLRHATWQLCEAGIVPVMLVHDGILFELESLEQVALAMRTSGREVCDGFEIGVDEDQVLQGGARYSDKRPVAQKMWATIMSALEAVRAIPRRA
jgi:DNA polymerase-1